MTTTHELRWADVRDVLAEHHVSYRQFDYWCRHGLLGADADARTLDGSGYARELSPQTVRRAAALGSLVRFGMLPTEQTGAFAALLSSSGTLTCAIAHLRVDMQFSGSLALPQH